MIETTVLDFKLSNTFQEYKANMEAPEQQAMFSEMSVKIFYLGVSKQTRREQPSCFKVRKMFHTIFFTNP